MLYERLRRQNWHATMNTVNILERLKKGKGDYVAKAKILCLMYTIKKPSLGGGFLHFKERTKV
jgi:hypothetical protein